MDLAQQVGAVLADGLPAWALALALLAGTGLGVMLVRNALLRWAKVWSIRTATGLDDLVTAVISRTGWMLALALGLLAALATLTLPPGTEDALRRVAIALGVLQAGRWGTALVGAALDRYVARTDPLMGNAPGVLKGLGVGAVWVIVVLLLLANLGVDVTAGIAGLGIGGVAVALALQNILGDLFASLSIVFDRPFGLGDFVVVGDYAGTVEHIGIKTTRMRSLSGEQLVFSNGDLLASRLRNYQDLRERRVVLQVGVAYGTPSAALRAIPEEIRAAVAAVPNTRFDRAHFFRFGDSSLDFEVVWFFLTGDYNAYMDAQQAVNLGVLDRLTALGVDIPFPQRTVWVRSDEGAAARPA